MKKYISLFLALLMLTALFAGCQKKDAEALEIFKTIKSKYLGSAAQQDVDKYIEYLTK